LDALDRWLCLLVRSDCPIGPYIGPIEPDLAAFLRSAMCPAHHRHCHAFECIAKSCKPKTRVVWRYLDKDNAKSTGNLRKHAKRCWGNKVVAAANKAKTARDVCDAIAKGFLDPQLITSAFKRSEKGKVSYSYRQFTKTKLKAEIVRWVSESMRPFCIVKDHRFLSLMKTGQPEYYIPS
jgi:hypothetical protein